MFVVTVAVCVGAGTTETVGAFLYPDPTLVIVAPVIPPAGVPLYAEIVNDIVAVTPGPVSSGRATTAVAPCE